MTQGFSTNETQLGDLLVQSRIIEPEQFDAAIRLSYKMRLPLGRVLTMYGHVSESNLRQALEIQARVRDGLIPFDHAIQALYLVVKEEVPLEAALRRLGSQTKQMSIPTHNRLGELLVASSFASKEIVGDAMKKSVETGLPIGIILLNEGVISRAQLNSVLTAQKYIREKIAERDQVVYSLKVARLRAQSIEQAIVENIGVDLSTLPAFGTGELYLLAGIISEAQLLTARELEVTEDKKLEDVFVKLGYVSKPCAKATGHLLKMISQGILFEDQAAQIIKKIQYASSIDELQMVLARLDTNPEEFHEEKTQIQITDILKKAGLISEKDLQIATALSLANKVPLIKTLFDAKLINESVMLHATQLKTYLDHELLKLEQATIVIVYCLENNLTVDETLNVFGWTAPI